MLDLKFIRENLEQVKDSARKRTKVIDFAKLLALDEERRKLVHAHDEARAAQKKASGKDVDVTKAKEFKTQVKELEAKVTQVEAELKALLWQVPNILLADVPEGKDESGNVVARKWGEPKKFEFKVKDHVELGERLGLIDIERAAKVTGARFAYLKGAAARLEVALISFVFDTLADAKLLKKLADSVEKGYSAKPFVPVFPPMLIKPEAFERMARLSASSMGKSAKRCVGVYTATSCGLVALLTKWVGSN